MGFIPYRFMTMIVLKQRNVESDGSKRAKWEPSISSGMCSKHFKPDDFARRLDVQEEKGDFADSMASARRVWSNCFFIDSCSCCCIWERAVSQWSPERKKNDAILFWANVLRLAISLSFLAQFFKKEISFADCESGTSEMLDQQRHQDFRSLFVSLDNLLTHYNNNIRSCFEGKRRYNFHTYTWRTQRLCQGIIILM